MRRTHNSYQKQQTASLNIKYCFKKLRKEILSGETGKTLKQLSKCKQHQIIV